MGKITLKEKYNHFIGGEWVEPENNEYFEGFDPSTGKKLYLLARGNKEDVNRAVKSAEKGFEEWSSFKPSTRGQILFKIAELIRKNKDDLAYLETMDTSRPLFVSEALVENSAKFFEYFGGAADKIFSEVIPATNEHLTYTLREPYGVTANIIPWNAPIQTTSRGVAAAFAAGNSVVLKTAEQAGISVLELARICIEAGMPPGVFNVITGFGAEAGDALIRHPGIQKITFTGSLQTGQHIMKVAAERIIPVTAELGGKSPNIVFEDADIDKAVAGSLKGYIFNSGQVCSAATRLLVQRTVLDTFVEKLVEASKGVKVGCGIDNPVIGPLISEDQMNRVLNYIQIGIEEGAEIIYGGNRIQEANLKNGYFIEPTIFTNVKNTMTIAREEIFGPVVSIIPFETEEEAIRIANDTEYGLSATVWTENIGRGHRVAKKIQAGEVNINDFMPIPVEAPFGGYKKSGVGREKGIESLHTYTQLKTISVRL